MISFSWIMLVMSPFMILLNFNWFMMWIMLELSTFSFLSILWNKWFILIHENRMKYFCIQTFSSIVLILLIYMIINNNKYYMSSSMMNLLILVIMLKLGLVPFHSWFIIMSKNMNMKNMFILMSWQKIIPIMMLLIFISLFLWFFMILINMFISVISQFYSFDIKLLMAFSSTSNISWMFISIMENFKTIFLFCLFYFFILGDILKKMKFINIKSINFNYFNSQIKWLFMSILSLSGIPPLLGFVPKWMVLKNSITFKLFNLILFLLIFSTLNTMIYFRICWSNLFLNFNILFNKTNYNDNNFVLLLQMSMILIILLM